MSGRGTMNETINGIIQCSSLYSARSTAHQTSWQTLPGGLVWRWLYRGAAYVLYGSIHPLPWSVESRQQWFPEVRVKGETVRSHSESGIPGAGAIFRGDSHVGDTQWSLDTSRALPIADLPYLMTSSAVANAHTSTNPRSNPC